MWKLDPLQIGLALVLDLALGDPPDWPHPTRVAGRLAALLERFLSRSLGRGVLPLIPYNSSRALRGRPVRRRGIVHEPP